MVTVCPVDCPECAQRKVACLECMPTRHFKGLAGHIQVHKMSLEDYRRKYSVDGTGEDVPVGWTVQSAPGVTVGQQPADAEIKSGVKQYDPLTKTLTHLSDAEKALYTERFTMLYRQADEDPALFASIRDIVMAKINIARIQEQQTRLTLKVATDGKINLNDIDTIEQLSKLIKTLQDTNLKLMDKLNITREKKQQAKKVVESTPSRYVSAYERFQRNFTPDQIRRAKQEEDEAVVRLTRKQDGFYRMAQVSERDKTRVDTNLGD